MNPSSKRSLAAALCVTLLATSLTTRAAHAEPTAADLASARDFMKEGKELRANGDHAGALKKFLAAYTAVPTPITGLAVAEEQIAVGQLVEARETLSAIERMPVAPNESEAGRQARDDAASKLTALVPRIPVIEVKITGVPAAQAVSLTIDGASVPPLSAEQGWRVNPGKRTVVASTAGTPDQTQTLEVKEGVRAKVVLTFPAATQTKTTGADVPAPTSPTSSAPTEGKGSPLRTIGLVTGGVGLVVIGIGGVLALSSKSAYSEAKAAHCSTGVCDAEGKVAIDDARSRAGTATIVMGVGAVVAVTGAVLWLTAPGGESGTKTGISSVNVGLGSVGIGGRF